MGRPSRVSLALLLLTVVGCAATSGGDAPSLRPATDLPDHFKVGTFAGDSASDPTGGATCSNPLVDPRDGTRLQLVRSAEGRGDYLVPPGRYGVRPGEILRVDCVTGRALGIARRD